MVEGAKKLCSDDGGGAPVPFDQDRVLIVFIDRFVAEIRGSDQNPRIGAPWITR